MSSEALKEARRVIEGAPALAVDLETSGTNPWNGDRITGIALANGEGGVYVPVGHVGSDNISAAELEDLLESIREVPLLVMHNALFDLSFLPQWYVRYDLWDTLVFAWLQDENQELSLKKLAGDTSEQDALKARMKAHCAECGATKSKKATKKQAEEWGVEPGLRYCAECLSPNWVGRRGWGELTYREVKDYATLDAEMTWRLYQRQQPLLGVTVEREVFERELRILWMAYEMMTEGLCVDLPLAWQELNRCEGAASRIEEALPFNVRSGPQVAEYLTEVCNLKLAATTPGGAVSVDVDALLPHQKHPIVAQVLEHRHVAKEGQFYQKLLELAGPDGRIHPRWRPTGTRSGRWSCSDPNAMQWPREGSVRKCIVAPEDYTLMSVDLKNAELRVAAHYSKCREMLDAFRNNDDLYVRFAEELGVSRQVGKVVILASQYGMGARKLQKVLAREGIVVPVKDARTFLNTYNKMFPEIQATRERAERVAWARGHVKLVHPGRVRHFEGAPLWRANPKDAFNAIVQGGVAEAMKNLMLELEGVAETMGVKIVAQVHDSLGFYVPHGLEDVWETQVDERWEQLNPFDVDIPTEWKRGSL